MAITSGTASSVAATGKPVVKLGCRVTVRHHDGSLASHRLLSGQRGAGWVAPYSALGVALLGRRVGDRVRPRGTRYDLEILAIDPIAQGPGRSVSSSSAPM